MKNKIKLLAIIVVIFTFINTNPLFSEEHSHNCHTHEIGVAIVSSYFLNDEISSYGWHLHYLKSVDKTDFSIGIGYERILGEHSHNTLGFVFNYKPIENLSFNLMPGIAYRDGGFKHGEFALHLETLYEVEIGGVHIGPILEYAIDAHEDHFSFGIHIGIGL